MSIESAARELAAWFASGNGVLVDIRHTAKVNGDRIMADVAKLKEELEKDGV
jgi:hypothetical protein